MLLHLDLRGLDTPRAFADDRGQAMEGYEGEPEEMEGHGTGTELELELEAFEGYQGELGDESTVGESQERQGKKKKFLFSKKFSKKKIDLDFDGADSMSKSEPT